MAPPNPSSKPGDLSSRRVPQTNSVAQQNITLDETHRPSGAVPLGEAIKRGWDWVVFSWQMLRRLGGPLEILQTFWVIISLLVTRLLVQLGILKKN